MDLNIQSFRIFCKVVDEMSFSAAARELKITQPTVSQQIRRIEEYLGDNAFERVGREIHLTIAGQNFYEFAREIVERTVEFSAELNDHKNLPRGLVRYAMPESCEWTAHYRKFMSQISEFPDIRFDIGVLPSEKITSLLVEGRIDFGFITGEHLQPELRFDKFADEHYTLVGAKPQLFESLKKKDPKTARFISYPGWDLFASTWFKASGIENKFAESIVPVVNVGSLAGAIYAVAEGAGVAILPTHCIQEEMTASKLIAYGKTASKSATLPIQIVRKVGRKLPRSAEMVIDALKTIKSKSY